MSLPARLRRSYPLIAFFALWVALLITKRAGLFLAPRFVTEDGTIFFKGAYEQGTVALLTPYAGYLQLMPRIFAGITVWLPITWLPAIYAWGWLVGTLLVLNWFARRLHATGASVNAAMVTTTMGLLAPQNGEVYFALGNGQWIAGLWLVGWLWELPSLRSWPLATWSILLGLSGPFSLLFAPLFWVKWKRSGGDRAHRLVATIMSVAGVIQLLCLLHGRTRHDLTMGTFVVNSLRMARDLYIPLGIQRHIAGGVVGTVLMGLGSLSLLVASGLWLVRHRALQLPLAGAGLVLAGGMYSMADRLEVMGVFQVSRYCYIPVTVYVLALVYDVAHCSRTAWLSGAVLAILGMTSLGMYSTVADKPIVWQDAARAIQRDGEGELPIQGFSGTVHVRRR